MLRQPIDVTGHPSAIAILRGIAITSGDCMMLGAVWSESRLAAFRAARCWRRSSVQVVAAGAQTSGYVPSTRVSHPLASAASA